MGIVEGCVEEFTSIERAGVGTIILIIDRGAESI